MVSQFDPRRRYKALWGCVRKGIWEQLKIALISILNNVIKKKLEQILLYFQAKALSLASKKKVMPFNLVNLLQIIFSHTGRQQEIHDK